MTPRDRHNLTLNILGEGLWGLQTGLIASATVLTVLLRQLGAGPTQIGLIPSFEGGLIVLPQIAGAWLFTSRKNRRRRLVLWHWLTIIPFLFLSSGIALAAPRLSPALARWALMGSFACFNLCIGVIVSVWLDWLAHLFHTAIRGTVMGLAFFSSAFLSAGGSLLAARLLAAQPGTRTYALLYLLAGILAFLSLLCFWFIDDPAEAEPDVSRRPSARELLDRFRESLAETNFRAFLVGRFLAIAGFCIMPFIAVYYQSVEGGGLGAASVVANGAALTLGTALAHLALGRLGDRHGHRLGVLVGVVAQVATLAALLTLRGETGCRTAYFCAGVCASAGFLSHSNLVLETCPHDHRLAHITVANLVMAVPMLFFPVLAGLLAQAAGLRFLFTLNLCFSVVATLWYLVRVREPRGDRLLVVAADPAIPAH